MRDKLKQRRDKFVDNIKLKRDKYNDMMLSKTASKMGFVYGISIMFLFIYFLGRYPHSHFYLLTTLILVCHIFWRHINYLFFTVKYTFYLVDFCYFSTYLLVYYYTYARSEEYLLRLTFLCANGALAVSTWAFKGTLAIHRVDSLTSLCIHVIPLIITNHIRWFVVPTQSSFSSSEHVFAFTPDSELSWSEWTHYMLIVPLIFYVLWVIPYAIVQFYIFPDYIKRKNSETLYLYFRYQVGWSKKILAPQS